MRTRIAIALVAEFGPRAPRPVAANRVLPRLTPRQRRPLRRIPVRWTIALRQTPADAPQPAVACPG